jgi:RimJ/RimL family protein N-acetyltransferase
VELTIREASAETHRLLATWRYPPPYDFYDGSVEPVLNPERFFEALDERGELIGFYYFEPKPPDLDYGLGLRPDLAGQGLGPYFFNAGLAFARERFRPRQVFLHVAAFNERARLVYERAGFRVVSSHVRTFEDFGDVAFLTMTEAEQVTLRRRQEQPEQAVQQRPEPQERPRPTREV